MDKIISRIDELREKAHKTKVKFERTRAGLVSMIEMLKLSKKYKIVMAIDFADVFHYLLPFKGTYDSWNAGVFESDITEILFKGFAARLGLFYSNYCDKILLPAHVEESRNLVKLIRSTYRVPNERKLEKQLVQVMEDNRVKAAIARNCDKDAMAAILIELIEHRMPDITEGFTRSGWQAINQFNELLSSRQPYLQTAIDHDITSKYVCKPTKTQEWRSFKLLEELLCERRTDRKQTINISRDALSLWQIGNINYRLRSSRTRVDGKRPILLFATSDYAIRQLYKVCSDSKYIDEWNKKYRDENIEVSFKHIFESPLDKNDQATLSSTLSWPTLHHYHMLAAASKGSSVDDVIHNLEAAKAIISKFYMLELLDEIWCMEPTENIVLMSEIIDEMDSKLDSYNDEIERFGRVQLWENELAERITRYNEIKKNIKHLGSRLIELVELWYNKNQRFDKSAKLTFKHGLREAKDASILDMSTALQYSLSEYSETSSSSIQRLFNRRAIKPVCIMHRNEALNELGSYFDSVPITRSDSTGPELIKNYRALVEFIKSYGTDIADACYWLAWCQVHATIGSYRGLADVSHARLSDSTYSVDEIFEFRLLYGYSLARMDFYSEAVDVLGKLYVEVKESEGNDFRVAYRLSLALSLPYQRSRREKPSVREVAKLVRVSKDATEWYDNAESLPWGSNVRSRLYNNMAWALRLKESNDALEEALVLMNSIQEWHPEKLWGPELWNTLSEIHIEISRRANTTKAKEEHRKNAIRCADKAHMLAKEMNYSNVEFFDLARKSVRGS